MEIKIDSLEHIDQAARQFVEAMGDRTLFAFYGEMGAGKTTFIKAVCEALGVVDMVNSPTFSIVNDYATDQGGHIYHFDFYRLKTPREALDFGIEEYFASGAICFMEWPEMIGDLLPDEAVKVRIALDERDGRTVQF